MEPNKNMALCKTCNQQIAKNAKVCPHCGAKNKKPIYKKWWFWVIIVVVIGAIGSTMGSDENAPSSPSTTVSQPPEGTAPTSTPDPVIESIKYGVGTYLVGKDIEAGLYRVVLKDTFMKMGYVERSKGVSMDFADILANIILTGDGYVEIKETDVAVKLTGVELHPVSLDELTPNIKTEVSDGIYLIGYDLAPGTYKVEVTDTTIGMAYVERTKNVAMDFSDIIANEIFQGQGYVEIKGSDFAIRVQGANLVLQ